MRDYVVQRGGAAVIPLGDKDVWINALPEGLAVRIMKSVSFFFASPRHRGAALHVPLSKSDSYGGLAERVRAFEGDSEIIDKLFSGRTGRALWESVAVPAIAKGARYLLPASRSASKQ